MTSRLRDRPFRLYGVDAHRLNLPLATPLVTGRGCYRQREIALLRVRLDLDGRARHGWGEVAPLPGWNEADLDSLVAAATGLGSGSSEVTLDTLLDDASAPIDQPALRHGLECGVLDALCRAAGVPMADALAAERGVAAARSVALHYTLGDCDADTAIAALAGARRAGFTHAKLKVGARPLRDDLERIGRIAQAIADSVAESGGAPRRGMILRLDANGAWEVPEALDMLAALPAEAIEWIEQPVADTALDALLARYDGNGPAIAADESCADPVRVAALLESARLGAIVVKPAALGGPGAVAALFERARAAGVTVVISNLIESAVGRAAAAHLAAAWPELSGPHGLATGAWLARDVASADRIDGGRLRPRSGAGLGFEPRAG